MILPAFFMLIKKRNHYDVIYVCGLRVLGVLGVFVAMLLGKKCVLRAESCGEMSGDFIWKNPKRTKSIILSRFVEVFVALRNRILKKADAFVSISQVIQDEFLNCGVNPHKIYTIANGIDVNKFAPVAENIKTELRKKLKIPDKIIFTYTGKLNKGKGLGLLLRVWKRLVLIHKEVHLVLVGGGAFQFLSCERALKDYVERESLVEYVTFTGYTENVSEYLQCADYFIFPSESEALGISLLEALSCGLPSLATRAGGIVDIIKNGENGKLVDVNDEEALYEGVLTFLYDSEKWKIIGESGRKSIRKYFSIEGVAEKHVCLFSSLLLH